MVSRPSVKAPPKISVVLPVYNAEKYLSATIESVLNQTFPDFECIIIDDCSTDSSWKIIQEYARKDVRIVPSRNNKNMKGCATLNKGLALARGIYIARVDNDDISLPDRFKKQYDFLEEHPKVGIVGGTMELISEDGSSVGKRKYHLTDKAIRDHLFRYSPFSHPLVMYRRSVLEKVGYYNPKYVPADDYELYFRIGKVAKLANLPDVLLQYRLVPSSMTHTMLEKMERATIAVRWKYRREHPYTMSMTDTVLTLAHQLSLYIIPSGVKMKLFNYLRNSN